VSKNVANKYVYNTNVLQYFQYFSKSMISSLISYRLHTKISTAHYFYLVNFAIVLWHPVADCSYKQPGLLHLLSDQLVYTDKGTVVPLILGKLESYLGL